MIKAQYNTDIIEKMSKCTENSRKSRSDCLHRKHKSHLRFVWTGGGTQDELKPRLSYPVKQDFSSLHRNTTLNCRNILHNLLLCALLLLCLSCQNVLCQTETCDPNSACFANSENLAVDGAGRSLDVSSTCGTNGVTIYKKDTQLLDPNSEFQCDATNVSASHPKEYMVDTITETANLQGGNTVTYVNPNTLTYWQSENTRSVVNGAPNEEWILLNLTEPFLIRYIRIIYVSPHVNNPTSTSDMRPKALCIESKRFLNDTEWLPLRYYAQDCSTSFPSVSHQVEGQVFSSTTPVCIQKFYATDKSTDVGYGSGRQEVIFDPSTDYKENFESFKTVQDHFSAAMIRIRMIEPANVAAESSYYAIANLGVWGQCSCYGHASGCIGTFGSECLCGHNTQGTNCESCLPLFNNKPWEVGRMCETCSCLNYRNDDFADTCIYNAVKGYGICNNCKFNTEGDKCDQCTLGFYQNPVVTNVNLTFPTGQQCLGDDGRTVGLIAYDCNSYCIPCNCSRDGSNPNLNFDCNRLNGQCFCKEFVQGRTCDECKDEYWNLQNQSPTGCQACNCFRDGTFNNTNLCDKATGNCICKTNVGGTTCSACKARNFGLSGNKVDGCTPCDCDPGGSFSLDCPVDSGECTCKESIGGRQCKTPNPRSYVPKFDSLTYDAEFAFNATNQFTLIKQPGHGEVNGTVTGLGLIAVPEDSTIIFENIMVPQSFLYESVLRYQSEAAWQGVEVTLQPMNAASVAGQQFVCSNGNTVLLDQPLLSTLQVSATQNGQGYTVAPKKCMRANTAYKVTLKTYSSNPAGSTLNIDSLVFFPPLSELDVYLNSDNATKEAMTQCFDAYHGIDPTLQANLSCPAYGYSLMADLYKGALPCLCDPIGSSSQTCDGQSGQCPCRPGVMLQDCSICKVYHYGFNAATGCTACNCDEQGSVQMDCNSAGICECKPNVIGNKCDQCRPGYWGRYTGNGCQLCNCDQHYSLNISCADSGQCYCKPGVGGQTCNQCRDGFYELTVNGCTECNCNPKGSETQMCNKMTGVCTCKQKVEGRNCDMCMTGYYGLATNVQAGCLQCFCSEHSSNCTSATGWYAGTVFNTWSLLDGSTANQERFTGVDDQGQAITVEAQPYFKRNGLISSELVMQITNDVASGNSAKNQLYYQLVEKYLGDKRASYGMQLTFALSVHVPVNATATDVTSAAGDLILAGKHTNQKMVATLPTPPGSNATVYTFDMVETTFQLNTATGGTVSYFQFMQVLADLDSILLRAKYKDAVDTMTRLYNVSLGVAVQNPLAGPTVSNVEQCACPVEYTGSFCEKCAPGYTRETVDGGPFSKCVPCNCNGHNEVPCDPDTGVCTCIHNTMGKNCETCNPGYYGYPLGRTPFDCKPCLCPGNVIESAINAFASTCDLVAGSGTFKCNNCTVGHEGDRCDQCQPNYYGVPADPTNNQGKCVPCKCNGLATICNSTSGFCVDCKNNTGGKECDICASGYHGNPSISPCQPCDCSSIGSTGECNDANGACVCKPNVVGFHCDQCDLHTYNYSSEGCFPCNCSTIGASSNNCNVTTGQCQCSRAMATGRRCDQCEPGFWNLNVFTGCDMCTCRPEGTLAVAGLQNPPCTVDTGQCTCKIPGITGRTCDTCAPGTTRNYNYIKTVPAALLGTYPDCKLCGECFDDWATKVETIAFDIVDKYQRVIVLWTHYDNLTYSDVQPVLDRIATQLSDVDGTIANVTDMFNQISLLGMGFVNMTAAANVLTMRLVGIAQDHSDLQKNLSALMSFNGIVPMQEANIQYSSPDIVDQRSLNIEVEHTNKFAEANSSWANIQTMTEAVNYDTQAYRDRVTAATSKKSLAEAEQNKATQMVEGEYPAQYAQNSLDLVRIEAAQEVFPGQISLIQATISLANESLFAAEETAGQADTSINLKRTEAEGTASAAASVRTQANTAQLAVQLAEQAVLLIKTLSDDNRGIMVDNLNQSVQGFATLENISQSMMDMDTKAAEIAAIQNNLRPASQLQETTGLISSTALDMAAVQAASQAAASALQVANEIENITLTASIESNKSLELVQQIDSTLASATSSQLLTNALRVNVSEFDQQIQTVVNDVQRKISEASSSGLSLDDSMTDLEASISVVKSCFVDKQVRAKAARQKVEPIVAVVNTANGIHGENMAKATDAQSKSENAVNEAQNKFQQLSSVEDDFQKLKDDMGSIGGTQDITNLLTEYLAQQSELTSINADLMNLDLEVATLRARVQGLESDLVSC